MKYADNGSGMKYSPRNFVILVLLFAIVPSGFARVEPAAARVPDGYIETAGIRSRISDDWLTGDPVSIVLREPVEVIDGSGNRARIDARRLDQLVDIRIEPLGSAGVQGHWILSRSLEDGAYLSITLYPLDNPAVYVRIRPENRDGSGSRSRLDIVAWNSRFAASIPIALSFSHCLTASLEALITVSRTAVPWRVFYPDTDLSMPVSSAADRVRSLLATLVYLEDGAFDDKGNPVHISDGSPQTLEELRAACNAEQACMEAINRAELAGGVNCAGFAKWLVDGIIWPAAGSRLFINALNTRTSSPETGFTEHWIERRDIFFALDWTRNLSSAVVSQRRKLTILPSESGTDVTVSPLAGVRGYQKDVGYTATELLPLLYWLAVHEGGHLYLGAISRERGEPRLREYHHIAAFFPWFDDTGRFHLAVFESARETAMDTFVSSNADAWIHLVRLRLPGDGLFEP